MISISDFRLDGLKENIVTDNQSMKFSFYYESKDFKKVTHALFRLSNGYQKQLGEEVFFIYDGEKLLPNTKYEATLTAFDEDGNEDEKKLVFYMGKGDTNWIGRWITDASYIFEEKGISPKVMTFKKEFQIHKKVVSSKLYITSIGVYKAELNHQKVGDYFLTPGFTSYKNNLMYQVYDVSSYLKEKNELIIHVAGGWAVGSFVFTRKNKVYADRQALLLELHLEYEDGTSDIIKSDDSFLVSEDSSYKEADLYDGEFYDATIDNSALNTYHKASFEDMKIHPEIKADYSSNIVFIQEMKPDFFKEKDGKLYYDFYQNFAGIIKLHIKNAKKGQKIIVHHAEVLDKDGNLDLSLLRSAKATLTYICKEGEQDYHPEFTYMGFRYITIEGIDKNDIEVSADLISSKIDEIGSFECSDIFLNRLDKNIRWSSRSNFEDIPTDCPQRDERMGWTGDISIFAPTASFNYNMERFLKKWLVDVKSEQLKSGALPNTVPCHGYGFPATMPKMAIDFWGDCILTVPYALYEAYGDVQILKDYYDCMKKYVEAEKFWANLLSIGKNRYIWHTPSIFHFGDWVSPDVDKMSAWQKRSKYTATASLCRCSHLLSKIASLLGYNKDAAKYEKLSKNVANAYVAKFTKHGKLKNKEFQTGYVLPLAFNMFSEKDKKAALENLVALIKKDDYCIMTGFPGTPYILFVLADNGYADVAYKMLLNTKAPSWLYSVKVGGTTIWEKFDGMLEDGTCRPSKDGTGNMVSFNHYASGSVGEFIYTRIGGLRILEPGYKSFEVRPVIGGGITYAKVKTISPYGPISVDWKIEDGVFSIDVEVPMFSSCILVMPNGEEIKLPYGKHHCTSKM